MKGGAMHGRRASDKAVPIRRRWDFPLVASPGSLRVVSWEEQRSQFVTRYLFSILGLVYFNVGAPVARSADFLVAVNVDLLVYLVLTSIYLAHARVSLFSPLRWRLAMWTDLTAVAFTALADSTITSPAYLVFLAIILGNGMRYGLRPFGEAALGAFLYVVLILYLRFTDQMSAFSMAGIFFILFGGIVVFYAYSLMVRIERHREQMAEQSTIDQLTGLLNRRGLEQRAVALFADVHARNRPLSVLFADLDGFKGINDTHGHHVGDTVLKKIAGMITASIRDTDVAARFGGDEFVVIMPDACLAHAELVAERLQTAVGQWSRSDDVALSLSIGMGEAPGHGRDLEELLRRVDGAMYFSKQSHGRGGTRRVDDVPA
jgi:diguanylate cyclase (GGDEF)-like protein